MRDVYPIKYYSKEGFVERKIEINKEDLQKIIEDYLDRHANRPMNIWLYAKCRKYVDEENPEDDQAVHEAELEITGEYDGNGIL
ncbi:TPA: hypothetical protein QCU24_005686 [Bacillus cereus]|nr:hypothetical protein [Bacillus cereus]